MNNLLLRSKHWQLFLLSFGIPMFVYMLSIGILFSNLIEAIESGAGPGMFDFENLAQKAKIITVIVIAFSSVVWLWFWSLGVGLQKFIPESLRLNTTLFKILYFIPVLYVIGILVFVNDMINQMLLDEFDFAPDIFEVYFAVLFSLNMLVLICSIYIMYFSAKSFKTAEKKKKVKFGDFVGEFFLLWIYPIGVWIVQPIVNKIIDNYTLENFDDESIIS